MEKLLNFSEENYKSGDQPEVRAEYTSLYLNYLRLFDEYYERYNKYPVLEKIQTSKEGKDFEEMMDFEREMISGIESMLKKFGMPEKN